MFHEAIKKTKAVRFYDHGLYTQTSVNTQAKTSWPIHRSIRQTSGVRPINLQFAERQRIITRGKKRKTNGKSISCKTVQLQNSMKVGLLVHVKKYYVTYSKSAKQANDSSSSVHLSITAQSQSINCRD